MWNSHGSRQRKYACVVLVWSVDVPSLSSTCLIEKKKEVKLIDLWSSGLALYFFWVKKGLPAELEVCATARGIGRVGQFGS